MDQTNRSKMDQVATRRDLLRMFAAAGTAGYASLRVLSAQANPRRVDVHHHFQPPTDGNAGLKWWTPEKSLEMMDKYGIAFAMMSNPGASTSAYDGTEKGNAAARRSNEFGAGLAQKYPKRIGFFAAIPMNNTDGALKEIAYALDTLKA